MGVQSNSCLFTDDPNCVLYIGFDRYKAEYLLDDSPYNNKVTLQDGAMVTKKDGSCGVCAQLLGGRISIDGKNFVGEELDLYENSVNQTQLGMAP